MRHDLSTTYWPADNKGEHRLYAYGLRALNKSTEQSCHLNLIANHGIQSKFIGPS